MDAWDWLALLGDALPGLCLVMAGLLVGWATARRHIGYWQRLAHHWCLRARSAEIVIELLRHGIKSGEDVRPDLLGALLEAAERVELPPSACGNYHPEREG